MSRRNKTTSEPKVQPGAVTVMDAARELGVSNVHITNLIEEGKLPAIDVGSGSRHFYRIPISGLAAFVARRNTMTNPEGSR